MGTEQLQLRNDTIPDIYKRLFIWGTGIDASSTADRERKRLKHQTPWWCNEVCLWPEGPRPLSPPPAPSVWDQMVRALERRSLISTAQPCFLPLGRTQGRKQKNGGGGEGSEPPQSEVTRLVGSQALSQEDRVGHQSLKLGPASLVLAQPVILSSSESQPPWVKKEIRTRSLTWEQFHVGEITWNYWEEKGGSRMGERVRLHGYQSFPSPTPQLCLLPNF